MLNFIVLMVQAQQRLLRKLPTWKLIVRDAAAQFFSSPLLYELLITILNNIEY